MRLPSLRFLPVVCVIYGLASLPAAAQQPGQKEQNASDAPPKLEKLEEGEAPAVTIRGSKPQTQITEKREQGRVTSVKVKSGNSTYYLKPNVPAGSALPGDAQSDSTRGAQWQIMEFDLGHQPDATQATGQPTDAAPPASAPAAQPAHKK